MEQKTDQMALAGFKALNQDSTKELTQMQIEMRNLKLDLTHEREFRRGLQGKLQCSELLNDDYNRNATKLGV